MRFCVILKYSRNVKTEFWILENSATAAFANYFAEYSMYHYLLCKDQNWTVCDWTNVAPIN